MSEMTELDFNEVRLLEQGEIKGLLETFEGGTNSAEIQDTFDSLKKLSRESKNSITTGIICQCVDKMNEGYIHPTTKEAISKGISQELFPLLFQNLSEKKEKLNPQRVVKLMNLVCGTENRDLEENVSILLRYHTDTHFKKILEQFLKSTK